MTATDIAGVITALVSLGLLVVGILGLRSLRIAARALKIESDPVIVVETLTPDAHVDDAHHVTYDVGLPEEPFRLASATEKRESIVERLAEIRPARNFLPGVTVRLRNVGRSAAVGLSLNGMLNVDGMSHAFRFPVDVLTTEDRVYITFVNRTLSTVVLSIFSAGNHRPDGNPELLSPIGYLAVRWKLAAIPGIKGTAVFDWIMRRPTVRPRLVYVYSPKTLRLRAPGGKA